MQFALIGPNQGKTIRLGGFAFQKGLTDVPEKAEDAQNLLRNFYDAHPVHLLDEVEGGQLVVREAEEKPRRMASVPAAGAPAPAPIKPPKPEKDKDSK